MIKSYKYRVYPNKAQQEMFAKTFGCVRYVYNYALSLKKEAYEKDKTNISVYDISHKIVQLKSTLEWLKEPSHNSLCNSLKHLDKAYNNFFRNKKGFPKFKSKSNNQSFTIQQCIKLDWDKSKLSIVKIKDIKIKLCRRFEGKIKNVTISKTPTHKYFASILVDDGIEIPEKPKIITKSVGIDVGIKTLAVLSNGQEIENPKWLKSKLKRLKFLQRRASRKKKGSNNRKKANFRVAKLHEKITNSRKDYLHKATTKIIRENQAVYVEDLRIKNMQKNHCLAQAISDASWGEFTRQLEYKSIWYGVHFAKVNPRNTSKMCARCGFINKELTLRDRIWTCPQCKTVLSRDGNASENIKNIGQEMSESMPVESIALASSEKQEIL